MANIQDKKDSTKVVSRQVLEGRYASARSNLLLMVALTVVNVALMLAGQDLYFLFSAFVPYLLPIAGTLFGAPVFIGSIVISALIVLLYFLCWLFSKKHNVLWLAIALALFCVDTVLMLLLGIDSLDAFLDSIFDILLHAWVIISLCGGIAAHKKLKTLPEEAEEPAIEPISAEESAKEQNTEE